MGDDDLTAAGFMFDAHAEKRGAEFSFGGSIRVLINAIDGEPGAVQSGHYVWPASPALCQYLIEQVANFYPRRVLELGAGVGLVGLTLAQLPSCEEVVFTDHDPGVLQLIEQNVGYIAADKDRAKCRYKQLEWGQECPNAVVGVENPDIGFDAVVGADVIYCKEVVRPLLITAKSHLAEAGSFWMCSSFMYSDDTECEIDRACAELHLIRRILVCKLDTGGTRVQVFNNASAL